MNVKSMMDCSFQEAMTAWNEGFQDYTVHLTMNIEALIRMMSTKHLSPEYSFLAFDGSDPVGIILNGIRSDNKMETAYNGGTAVHPDYRKVGTGQKLVEASLEKYEKEGVQLATLEAISTNKAAIKLYEKNGYIIQDHLDTIELNRDSFKREHDISMKLISMNEWEKLSFPSNPMPWQNRISSIDHGEIYQFYLGRQSVGYALLSRSKNQLTLFHLQAREEEKGIYERILRALNQHFKQCKLVAFNTPQSYEVNEVFHKHASKKLIEQVWMERS
jgi:GNAT superfamily N-acetyltransferase